MHYACRETCFVSQSPVSRKWHSKHESIELAELPPLPLLPVYYNSLAAINSLAKASSATSSKCCDTIESQVVVAVIGALVYASALDSRERSPQENIESSEVWGQFLLVTELI